MFGGFGIGVDGVRDVLAGDYDDARLERFDFDRIQKFRLLPRCGPDSRCHSIYRMRSSKSVCRNASLPCVYTPSRATVLAAVATAGVCDRSTRNATTDEGVFMAAPPDASVRPSMWTSDEGQVMLSPRELDVLALVAEGCRDYEIAARLFVSPHTVANHMKRILEKLGTSSRSAAVARALRAGWL